MPGYITHYDAKWRRFQQNRSINNGKFHKEGGGDFYVLCIKNVMHAIYNNTKNSLPKRGHGEEGEGVSWLRGFVVNTFFKPCLYAQFSDSWSIF